MTTNKYTFYQSLDEFTTSYIESLLWSETDNANESGGEPLDRNYDWSDFTLEALHKIKNDCKAFQEQNAELLTQAGDDDQNGHDFCLTRNGHGAGFWDRGYGDVGDKLTQACRPYGEMNVTVYRGKLYV